MSESELTSLARPMDQAMQHWNATAAKYPDDTCVHQLFEAQVFRTPDATALVFGSERLSYRELDERANRLAHWLKAKGCGSNVYVGICMHRSIQMIVAMLGVLKAGSAYVPLDASYPEKRLNEMLGGIRICTLLTSSAGTSSTLHVAAPVIDIDGITSELQRFPRERLPFAGTPRDLAYLVFTSGSTGAAKATRVMHRGWTNLLHWFRTTYSITPSDRVLVMSSFSFDITQRSIMMPLISGGELHLLASKHYEPELVLQTMHREQITIMNSAPSMLYPLLEWPTQIGHALASLRWLFLGGEPIVAARLKDWATSASCNATVVNVYGVAECTDVSTAYTLVDYEKYTNGSVPLGTPIANTKIYILDQEHREVAPGEVGEICIGGDGIGLGYENARELNGSKFLPDTFTVGAEGMVYRTGDLGSIGSDWNLEYRGRVDHQVKISGVRVELGDVEAAVRSHPQVKDVVVVAGDDAGELTLSACILCNAGVCESEFKRQLREYLRDLLPSPMLPSRIYLTKTIPLNPNGKVDRQAVARLIQSVNRV